MRLRFALLLLAGFAVGCGTTFTPIEPPPAPPPVVPPPDVPVPPPTPPPAPPATVDAALALIRIGATLAEVTTAVGVAPAEVVPADTATPATARWFVTEGDERWMVYAVLDAGNRVTRKGSTRLEVR